MHTIIFFYDFVALKADVHSLKQECEKYKVCTNHGVTVSYDL